MMTFERTHTQLQQPSPAPLTPSDYRQKRERQQSSVASEEVDDFDLKKRQRNLIPDRAHSSGARSLNANTNSSIEYWTEEQRWPKEYALQESSMNPLLSRKRSSSSIRGKQSETSEGSFRDGKNPAIRSRLYNEILSTAGIHMGAQIKTTEACKDLCKILLSREQELPADSLFRDDRFEKTCARLCNENKAMVFADIFPLIVPRAEILSYDDGDLEILTGHINQQWHGCIPIVPGPSPQPDYSVGFKKTAFTVRQLQKLEPFIKGWKRTPFLATAWMYFPFLMCEVKCGDEGLNIADRQNAHSASVAVRSVFNLYRAISRQNELQNEILAFTVSHDHETVRIYGHFAVINGDETSFYRHPIKKFDIASEERKDKWTAYRFTRNVYDIFVPKQLDRIRTAIDQLPELETLQSQQSEPEFVLLPDQMGIQSTLGDSQDLASVGPSSMTSEPSLKKSRGM